MLRKCIDNCLNWIYCISVINTIGGQAMFVLDYKTKIPIYEQIQSQVVSFIALGIFKPDQQLPAVRQLASDLGVNPNTVQKAYQELERLGYIYSHTGKGSFISPLQDSLALVKQEKKNDLSELLFALKALGVTYQEVLALVERTYKQGEKAT
jgi:GntR family transcriptional regulator